ncbi:MAG: hypothetical protein RLZZ123_1561, partial [Pseudomonadota bacterium]
MIEAQRTFVRSSCASAPKNDAATAAA